MTVEESPVHCQVPDKEVGGIDKKAPYEAVEQRAVLGIQRAQDTNTGHNQFCAVLARIDQMSLVFGVMKLPVINVETRHLRLPIDRVKT